MLNNLESNVCVSNDKNTFPSNASSTSMYTIIIISYYNKFSKNIRNLNLLCCPVFIPQIIGIILFLLFPETMNWSSEHVPKIGGFI